MSVFRGLRIYCCSVTKLCQTLWGPMGCSMPGFPVLHYLLEFVQIHVHWVSEAIQLSHSLSPSSPALDLSQHQVLFQWVGSLHQIAKVYWSFSSSLPKNIQGWFPLELMVLISMLSKDSQESSPALQLKGINFSVLRIYGQTLTSIHDY